LVNILLINFSGSDSDEMAWKPTEAAMKDTSNSVNDFDSLLSSPNSSPIKPNPKPKAAPAKKEAWESSEDEANIIDKDTDDEDFSLVSYNSV
jgi:hypothetical protein